MDTETAQNIVINWIGQAPWKEKYEFMRTVFGAVPEHEAKTFGNMINKTLRVSKRKRFEDNQPSSKHQKKDQGIESVPLEPVPSKLKAWFSKYKESEIVSMDCEHVHYVDDNTRKRVKAATVSIVDHRGKQLYFTKVYHARNSFKVNQWTRAINGFTANSFVNRETCKDLEKVREEVLELLTNKLVITYSGATDFESLNIMAGDFDHFDIAEYFKRPKLNRFGEDVGEKISLRSLHFHYFKEDIQNQTHSPYEDAKATMKLLCTSKSRPREQTTLHGL